MAMCGRIHAEQMDHARNRTYLRLPMRLLAVLLSLYVFMLSTSVCSDDGCDGKGVVESTVAATSDHADHIDLCSPFCTCSCCAGVMMVKAVAFPAVSTSMLELHAPALAAARSVPHPAVWQPPQA